MSVATPGLLSFGGVGDLHTDRLLLRRWRATDREPFARLNADPEVMRYFPASLTRKESDQLAERIDASFDEHGLGLYAVELRAGGAFIGFVGLSLASFDAHFTPAVEIGWRLAREAWGQGFASEAGHAVLARARELRLSELVSFTTRTNVPSRNVMERLGMTHCPEGDFDHPRVPLGHPLRPHVLYRLALRPRRRVFVYGSLLPGEANHAVLAGALPEGAAASRPGFELRDLGPYPGMVRAESGVVYGQVFGVDAHLLAELDRFEGHPELYRRTPIRLADDTWAEAYLLAERHAAGHPVIPSGRWRRAAPG